MHEAQRYLLDASNPPSLHVRIAGKKRRLFINRPENVIGIIDPGKRKTGRIFNGWDQIEKIFYPSIEAECDRYTKLTAKFVRYAQKATFTNPWLRKVLAADPEKSPYENRITTGTKIDGDIISLQAVEKHCGWWVANQFRKAVKERRPYHSERFDFHGYDGSLWVEIPTGDDAKEGDIHAGFCKEYRNCGNGYYFLLVNDDNFIGYDID